MINKRDGHSAGDRSRDLLKGWLPFIRIPLFPPPGNHPLKDFKQPLSTNVAVISEPLSIEMIACGTFITRRGNQYARNYESDDNDPGQDKQIHHNTKYKKKEPKMAPS
jgi:hypothetical protein